MVEELCTNSSRHQKEIADIQQYIAEGKITVYQVQNENIVKKLYVRLHYGELEVIIGAKEYYVPLAVIDERTARKMAANFLVDTIGILEILLLAKKQGILKNIKSDIDMLRTSGYRISEVCIDKFYCKIMNLYKFFIGSILVLNCLKAGRYR